jgi:hypothetical protein
MPNATQPQSVLFSDSSLFDAAAAPAATAAGFTPVVVVAGVDTATVAVWMFVTVTGFVVVTAVVWVTVAAGRAGSVVVSTAVVVCVVVSRGVVGVLRVGVVRVAVGSVAVTPVEIAACSPPPPHPGIRSTTSTQRKAVVRVPTTASTVGGRPQGCFMQNG